MSELSKSPESELITSVDELIDRLGGNSVVARLFDPPLTPNAVGNWRDPERGLPAESFLVLTTALNARSLYAPPSLWKFRRAVETVE